jgi:cytochrome c oxidase assembly factor CtaG
VNLVRAHSRFTASELILVAMHPAPTPLTWAGAASTWSVDIGSVILIVLVGAGYGWCYRGARKAGTVGEPGRAWCCGIAIAAWVLATMSMVGTYSAVLFWVRALQVLLLLFVVPFFLAMSTPLTMLRNAMGPAGRDRIDRSLATPLARLLTYPLTTSVAMLATPWLLYLTPWYTAALENRPVAAGTRVLLVLFGFGYFYSRLQADPVPRRYSQMISMVISIAETLGDGLLGIVLWLGPLIAVDYYAGLQRDWGPSPRVDQSIGAGILWILGDVLGVPFLIVLMRAMSADEKAHGAEIDAELDRAEESRPRDETGSTLWWQDDPQLRDRFRNR